jgi:hypothetical protein
VTKLIQRMREELVRRNYAETTIRLRIPVKPNGIPEEAEQHSELKANSIEA